MRCSRRTRVSAGVGAGLVLLLLWLVGGGRLAGRHSAREDAQLLLERQRLALAAESARRGGPHAPLPGHRADEDELSAADVQAFGERLRDLARDMDHLEKLLGQAAAAGGANARDPASASAGAAAQPQQQHPPPAAANQAVQSSSLPLPFGNDNADEMLAVRERVVRLNAEQPIANLERFPDTLQPGNTDFVAIVIMVHKRATYLRHTLEALSALRGIEHALLIISQDYESPDITALLDRQATFCPLLRIFFPGAAHIHPGRFPGTDPRDCPARIPKADAIRRGCLNAEHPDTYGNYREAKFVMIKHHWWWKNSFVFDHVKALQNYEGPVLFLEADHYLAPDALHVLRLLDSTRHMHCAQCRVMTMGMYQPVVPGDLQAQKAVRVTWASNLHNMAMAYNRSTWLEIKRCASQFCQYDDYNWDWTLMHLSKAQCFGPQHLQTLVAVPPRALHFGQCGTHTKEKKGSCDPTATINRYLAAFKRDADYLFPNALEFTPGSAHAAFPSKPNGGWGDPRDIDMCNAQVQ